MQKKDNDGVYCYKSSKTFKNELNNIHIVIKQNYEIDMHMQEFFEINIVTRGKGKHYIVDNVVDTEIGDVFVIPPMVKHAYTGGEGFDVFHILISDKFIKKNLNSFQCLPSFFALFTANPLIHIKTEQAPYLKLLPEQFETINTMLSQVLDYSKKEIPFSSIIKSGFTMAIISFLCMFYTENNKNQTSMSNNSHFTDAITYIHENYHSKITIDDLAKIAYVSRSTFVKKFKETFETTPQNYITKRRIEVAEYMLLNTNFSFSDIALKTGFYDASHFSRVFEQNKGVSPAVYRKNEAKP